MLFKQNIMNILVLTKISSLKRYAIGSTAPINAFFCVCLTELHWGMGGIGDWGPYCRALLTSFDFPHTSQCWGSISHGRG
jgi:hypothetical protein